MGQFGRDWICWFRNNDEWKENANGCLEYIYVMDVGQMKLCTLFGEEGIRPSLSIICEEIWEIPGKHVEGFILSPVPVCLNFHKV